MGEKFIRTGVSFPKKLLDEFDKVIEAKGYQKRSRGICDAMRHYISEYKWEEVKGRVVGIISAIYDHETTQVSDTITKLQHHQGDIVISTMHVHLDERSCLEVITTKGEAKKIKELAAHLMTIRGVKHLKLLTTST